MSIARDTEYVRPIQAECDVPPEDLIRALSFGIGKAILDDFYTLTTVTLLRASDCSLPDGVKGSRHVVEFLDGTDDEQVLERFKERCLTEISELEAEIRDTFEAVGKKYPSSFSGWIRRYYNFGTEAPWYTVPSLRRAKLNGRIELLAKIRDEVRDFRPAGLKPLKVSGRIPRTDTPYYLATASMPTLSVKEVRLGDLRLVEKHSGIHGISFRRSTGDGYLRGEQVFLDSADQIFFSELNGGMSSRLYETLDGAMGYLSRTADQIRNAAAGLDRAVASGQPFSVDIHVYPHALSLRAKQDDRGPSQPAVEDI